jgi:DNA-binding transcriptional LysR family regulator
VLRDELNLLAAFAIVAEEGSFTKAAKRLEVSTSALSHAIRGLERSLGVQLLARTTRSVAPSAAGEQLLVRLRPALAEVEEALNELGHLRQRPSGRLRLVVPRAAEAVLLRPKLATFARDFPEITLEIVTSDRSRVDLVAERFDAGIHLGEFIDQAMTTLRISPDLRMAVVGTPAYFQAHGIPSTPHELTQHRCLAFRLGDEIYRWEFQRDGQAMTVGVDGPLVVDNVDLQLEAVLEGIGLAFFIEDNIAAHLESGRLVRVLEDWCPPFSGYFLYFPSRKHQPAALTALINALRLR